MGIPDAKNKSGCVGRDWFEVEKRISPLRSAPVEMTISCFGEGLQKLGYS
jgi:hypothetical protein